jgi:CHASE1-domain containing sensor protein
MNALMVLTLLLVGLAIFGLGTRFDHRRERTRLDREL